MMEPGLRVGTVQGVRLFLLVGLASVVLAAGCGSSSSSSSDAAAKTASSWADGFCTALATYKNAITQAAANVKENGVSKASLRSAVDDVSAATKTFGSDVEALDAPATSTGASAKKTVKTLADEVQTQADTVQAAVSNGTPTLSLLSTIQTALTRTKNALATATTQLEQLDAESEVRSALTSAPTCKPFFGS
jgi:chromosome segregation ATPase